jgi:hypothetical protein
VEWELRRLLKLKKWLRVSCYQSVTQPLFCRTTARLSISQHLSMLDFAVMDRIVGGFYVLRCDRRHSKS